MPPKKQKILVPPEPFLPEFEPDVTEIKEIDQMKPLISIVTGEPFGPKIYYVREKEEDESSDDEPESEGEDDERFLKNEVSDISSEFWIMQKLIKYMKAGNQTATTISLCLLKDYDLTNRAVQKTIEKIGGLEILVNLLETNDIKCQNGSLSVLLVIVTSSEMSRILIDYGIVTSLIQLLKHPVRDIQILAAEIMAIIARIRKARKQIRIRGGIPLLLDIMDIPDNVLQRSFDELNNIQKELLRVAVGGARALNSIAKSPKIKAELQKYGVVQHMARFLKSVHTNLIIPIMGTVQQCADLSVCRFAFEQMGIIADIVYHLKNEDMKLKENCALAIFKCAINKTTSNMVREAGGLDPLCKLIQDENVRANKHLLIAVTGAIWKCAVCSENVKRFNQNNLVAFLVPLLQENEEEDVLSNVVGALAECCKDPTNRDILRAHDGLPKLIKLLSFTYEPLLENIPLVLKECAENTQCMDIINDPGHKLDGVRLIWSLLKHPNDVIKTNACLALVPCIKYAKDSPEMVRAFVGGLELTVSLLDSTNPKVLSAVCATIASIALDPENLGILTDHGVVSKLASLAKTENEDLRANLTLAIAYCCEWDDNSSEFGKLKIIAPLVGYMNTKNQVVLKGVCIAMYHLSKDPMNCVTMHSCGIIKHMLRLIGSEDPEVQIAAASTIRHIRKLALTAERLHFKEINLLEEMNYQL
ncbi:armadillo repeat-containing protein gudu-like isoform X1 [Vespa mandarinia]|uniref:armadillo repeat-containing protein gudu-like isoform X1 n=1 Tax=Vespa mandarinia TaxID=7446 RepID=UPI00160C7E48|nr:armadillo repeat-containing protein gudu-like isoform X1 [Vespa mandarinia]